VPETPQMRAEKPGLGRELDVEDWFSIFVYLP